MEQSKLIKTTVLNKMIAIILVFCLITANYALTGASIAEAADEMLESATITKNSNIEFDAYFKGSTNVETKTPVLNSEETQKLFLKLNVKDNVSLVDGKIKLEDPNFTIKKEELKENEFVNNVDAEKNEIELKKIYSNTAVEIELPIQFKVQDKIETNYFEKDIIFNLSGKYENNSQKQKKLKGKVTVRPQWNVDAKVNLTQSVEKFFNLGENGTIFQEKITTEVVNNALPRSEENIEVMIPTIAEQKPSQVVVLVNGERQNNSNVSYDSEQEKIIIKKTAEQDKDKKIEWGTDKVEYTLAFKYDNKIESKEVPVSLNSKATTFLYTKTEAIQNEYAQDVVIAPIGNVATVFTTLFGDIYKGYIYHNEAKATEYKEKNDIEISYVDDSLEKLELQTNTSAFLNEAGAKVADSTSVTYKQTQFQKQELFNILGNEGKVTIKRANGEVISEVTNDTETDDKGIITVSYANPETSIIIETTKPQIEGRITVLNTKEISGQTNQNIDALKVAKYLATAPEITTNLSKETNMATIELKEPTTEAKLTINKTDLSTLNTNNVKIVATLVSNDERHELFRNPKIQIRLPEQVQSVKVNSINKLYADELQFGSTSLVGNAINIELVGEQAGHLGDVCEGIQVVVDCDITFDKTIPSTSSKVELSYTNENSGNAEQIVSQEVRVSSKYGAMLYSKLDSINKENESIETFTEEIAEGEIDAKAPAKQTNAFTEIVNNYEEPMTNVEVVIDLTKPTSEEEKNIVDLKLLSNVIAQKDNTQILYATENIDANSEGWQEQVANLQDVKKVKLVTEELKPGETIPIVYSMTIPENILDKKAAYQMTTLNYKVQEQDYQTSSNLKLKANEDLAANLVQGEAIEQNIEGLKVNAQTYSVGKEVRNGGTVHEGQTIRYVVTVKNDTGKNLNNFALEAKQADNDGNQNVTFWNTIEKDAIQEQTGEHQTATYYREDDSIHSMKFQKETLQTGETAIFQYEFSINETTKDSEITKGQLNISATEIGSKQLDLMQNPIEQAELKVTAIYNANEEVPFQASAQTTMLYTITNLTDEELEHVNFTIMVPEGAQMVTDHLVDTEDYKVIKIEDNIVELEITKIEGRGTYPFGPYFRILPISYDKSEQTYGFSAGVGVNGNVYYSNEIAKTAKQDLVNLQMTQESDFKGEYVKSGDEITFVTTITNLSTESRRFTIEDSLHDVLQFEEGYISSNGVKIADLLNEEDTNKYKNEYDLKGQETIQVIEKVKVKENEEYYDYFIHYINVYNGVQVNGEETALRFNFEIKPADELNEAPGEKLPVDPDGKWQPGERVPGTSSGTNTSSPNPSSPSGSSGGTGEGNNSNEQGENEGSIRGQVWLDTNKDGIKTEGGFAGIGVFLINTSTGNISSQTVTDNNGNYTFQKVPSGEYIVGFEYDTNKYSITQYKAAGSDDSNDCDVVNRDININGEIKRMAVSDTIQINGNAVTNVDAGFIENQIFDLTLDKGVRKITVKTARGTKEYTKKDVNLAKIEINRKEIQNATVTIEYVIKVKNEGETPGLVGDIIDYVPTGMNFDSDSNKDWSITNGELHNQSLASKKINPNETKEVSLILTKTMSESNTGAIQNIVEIAQATNDLGQLDKDSTPGNNKEGEDDQATADVIISIGTGVIKYIVAIIAILLVLGTVAIVLYNNPNVKKRIKKQTQGGKI